MREPGIKNARKTRKRGGKTFATSKPVTLNYNNNPILCDVCKSNNYTEVIGTIDKSKVRSGFGQFFFGEAAEILDNTSVIIYTCNACGMCKIVRNIDNKKITVSEINN